LNCLDSSGDAAMILSAKNIDRLHRGMEHDIGGLIRPLIGRVVGNEGWKRQQAGKVAFQLRSGQRDAGVWDWQLCDRGDRRPVFQATQEDDLGSAGWAGWYEEWCLEGENSYALVGASWTFFWGPLQRPKVQLFRAEWDSVDRRGQSAPQPHWHFDREAIAIASPHARKPLHDAQQDSDLIELRPAESNLEALDLSLQEVHLSALARKFGDVLFNMVQAAKRSSVGN